MALRNWSSLPEDGGIGILTLTASVSLSVVALVEGDCLQEEARNSNPEIRMTEKKFVFMTIWLNDSHEEQF